MKLISPRARDRGSSAAPIFKGPEAIKGKLRELYRVQFGQHAPLAPKGAQFNGLYKLRVGDWRLIYKIERTELLFITARPQIIRSEVHRK